MSTTTTPAYAFLSQPPPQVQKKQLQRHLASSHPAPSLPLPPIPNSSSTTPSKEEFSIASWAAQVQPGSPGTPSPRRSSTSTAIGLGAQRRPSLIRRRSASRGIAHIRVPSNSTSFVHLIDTPSTGGLVTPKTADLRALGYTNIFVNLPPATPKSAGYALGSTKHNQPAVPALTKKKTLSRFRSLSALRPSRAKNTTPPIPSPTSPMRSPLSSPKHPRSPTKHGRSRSRSKSGSNSPTKPSVSAHRRMHQSKSKTKAPPSPTGALMQDALLAQFLGGGKLDKQAQRLVPKGDAVWRDGKGGLWRDEDEKVEGLPLLDHSSSSVNPEPASPGWVKFQPGAEESPLSTSVMDLGDGRRGSAGSVCTEEMMSREPMALGEAEVPRIVWSNPSSSNLPSLTTATTATSTPEISVTPTTGADRTMRRRHRPTPLNLKRTGDGFEDSFAPSPSPMTQGSSRRLNFAPASSALNPASCSLAPTASSSNLALAVPRMPTSAQPSPMSIVSEAPTQSQRGFGGLKSKASKMGLKKLFGI